MARERGTAKGPARARGRQRAAHETQVCSYPLRSKRQTRNSRAVSSQSIIVPPSWRVNHNPRILETKRETAEAECSHGSSQPTRKELVIENIVEDGAPPILTVIASCGPSTKKEDGFCAKITSRVEGHHQGVDGVDHPPRENTAGPSPSFNMTVFARGLQDDPVDDHGFCAEITSPVEGHHQHIDDDVQPPRENTACPSPSFNVTEYVRGLPDASADRAHEVESAPSVGYDDVHGYKVKIELAGLVGAIFGRYGDIVVECDVKFPSFLQLFFDRLCVIYKTLEEKKLSEITCEQINEMLEELRFFKSHQVNVEWLLHRLLLISNVKSKKYLAVKEEAEKHFKHNSVVEETLKLRWKHKDRLQMKISALKQEKEENDAMISDLEQQKVRNQAKVDACTQMAIDIRTRVQDLANRSLVHGLL